MHYTNTVLLNYMLWRKPRTTAAVFKLNVAVNRERCILLAETRIAIRMWLSAVTSSL